ncbi:MAG: three-Cys-motif partner protein TcmP [Symploca sp. SIO2E9]|nr:three-Cys-motif partner protein TcmP [Symploca sp. SIO2E9]
MSEAQAKWSTDGIYIPYIDPHTKAKHQILEEYIKNLIFTLYGKGRYGVTKFTFIDGFCGGGIYNDKDNNNHWYGSPIKIIKAVREGYVKSRRQFRLDVKFIFIEKKQDHLDCLKNYAMPNAGLEELVDEHIHEFNSEFGTRLEQCEFRCGEFEDLVNECLFKVDIRKGHSFFLLDPFGWTDVSMESIRKINSLAGSEILYTYMIDFIKRFLSERYGKQKHGFQEILEADGYYESANLANLDRTGQQWYLRNESMKLFRERGQAKYVFTFSLIPRGEVIVLYYLMHLSKNLTALEVIKESFWEENNLDYQYCFEVYGHGFRTADFL